MFPVRIKSKNIVGIWAGACSMPVQIGGVTGALAVPNAPQGKQGIVWVPLGIVAIGNTLVPFPLDDIEPMLDFEKETVDELADERLDKD